jgi:transposase
LREIEVIELLLRQIAEVEAERDAASASAPDNRPSPVATLMRLKAVGPQIAATLYVEGLFRTFANRREVAAYAGLVPTPWRSGTVQRQFALPVGDDCGGRVSGFSGDGRGSRRGLCGRRS